MPNGATTFKHAGKTYGLEEIFSASEARGETYSAFGRETSFLTKLVKLGFIVHKDTVFHPDHWQPIPDGQTDGFFTQRYVSRDGKVRLGRSRPINKRR